MKEQELDKVLEDFGIPQSKVTHITLDEFGNFIEEEEMPLDEYVKLKESRVGMGKTKVFNNINKH